MTSSVEYGRSPAELELKAFSNAIEAKTGARFYAALYRRKPDFVVKLYDIEVPKGQRKRGVGTAIMEALARFADERGYGLILEPARHGYVGGTTSRTRLVRFYKRFGFVENKGRHKDFTLPPGMIRWPQPATPTSRR
jgi:GNAT superfamily N-acetyltransferase